MLKHRQSGTALDLREASEKIGSRLRYVHKNEEVQERSKALVSELSSILWKKFSQTMEYMASILEVEKIKDDEGKFNVGIFRRNINPVLQPSFPFHGQGHCYTNNPVGIHSNPTLCASKELESNGVKRKVLETESAAHLVMFENIPTIYKRVEKFGAKLQMEKASGEEAGILRGIISSVGVLLTTQEVVAALKGCVPAICDKVFQSAKGSIIAVTDLIVRRGAQLGEADVLRIIQALFSAASEHPQARVVYNKVLGAVDKDASRTKQKGAWPVHEAYLALANHRNLSLSFLNHVVGIINHVPVFREDKADKADPEDSQNLLPHTLNKLPAAATLALGCFFRSGNEVARKAVDQQYSAGLCALILRIGSCHGTVNLDTQPLRDIIPTFQSFCDCVGDEETCQVLMRDEEHQPTGDRWTEAIEEIAACSAKSRPQEKCKLWQYRRGHTCGEKGEKGGSSSALGATYSFLSRPKSCLEQEIESWSAHVVLSMCLCLYVHNNRRILSRSRDSCLRCCTTLQTTSVESITWPKGVMAGVQRDGEGGATDGCEVA